MLHCAALGNCITGWDADCGEHWIQGFIEPLDEGSPLPSWHHDGQQASLANSKNHLNSTDANQIAIPVAEDCVRRRRIRIGRGAEPFKQFLGTAQCKHIANSEQARAEYRGGRSLSAAGRSRLPEALKGRSSKPLPFRQPTSSTRYIMKQDYRRNTMATAASG